jgi:AhpD family alkylhydroperoxidase
MARLPFVAKSDLPADQQDLQLHQNFQRVYANSPQGLRAFTTLSGYVRERSPLDPKLRELAILQVCYATECPYAFTHHVKVGLAAGLTPDQIRAVRDDAAGRPTSFGPVEKAVLQAARDLATGAPVSDAVFATLHEALGNEQLMDLLFDTVHYLGMTRLLTTLQVEIEDDYRAYLKDYPM